MLDPRDYPLFFEGVIRLARNADRTANAAFSEVCNVNGIDPRYAPPTLRILVAAVYNG